MIKSNKGFTLVELIVVIAILAILAGVAIPVYNNYIQRAQDAAVITELDAIQTAAQAANATAGGIDTVEVTGSKIVVTAATYADNFEKDFVLFYPGAAADATTNDVNDFTATVDLDGTSYEKGAIWTAGEWDAVE